MPPSRFNRASWPPDGPHRDLLEFLDQVHRRHGCRSLRMIGDAMHVSHARVHDIVRGSSLPVDERQTRGLVVALVGDDEVDVEDLADRAAALFVSARRARDEGVTVRSERVPDPVDAESGTAGVDSPVSALHPDGPDADEHGTPSRRRRSLVLVGLPVVVLLLGVFLMGHGMPNSIADEERSTAATDPPAPTPSEPSSVCAMTANGSAVVQPQLTDTGVRSGLRFCPVRINGGNLPITGPFTLEGQAIGPLSARRTVLLINHGDPRTCDALGNAPAPGAFLMTDAALGSSDGAWSLVDSLGYDEAVTIARHYEYVTASPTSIAAIREDRQVWNRGHPGAEGDYPGMLALPADTTTLARFDVPAGEYFGARPCGSSG